MPRRCICSVPTTIHFGCAPEVIVHTVITGVLVASLFSACGDPTATVSEPDVRPHVTGALLPHIDGAGHFIIQNVAPPSAHETLGETAAHEIALAFVRTFASPDVVIGTSFGELWQKQRGTVIDWRTLRVSGAVIAQSPYADVPVGSPGPLRNLGGPSWIVRLSDEAGPALSVEVALYETGLSVENGRLRFPPVSGNALGGYGNDILAGGLVQPIGPERAAIAAAKATGALVSSVPVLALPERIYHYTFARWRVDLDRDVTFQVLGSASERTSRTVYVGVDYGTNRRFVRHDGLFLPALVQPDVDTVRFDPVFTLRRRPDVPVLFERVTVPP